MVEPMLSESDAPAAAHRHIYYWRDGNGNIVVETLLGLNPVRLCMTEKHMLAFAEEIVHVCDGGLPTTLVVDDVVPDMASRPGYAPELPEVPGRIVAQVGDPDADGNRTVTIEPGPDHASLYLLAVKILAEASRAVPGELAQGMGTVVSSIEQNLRIVLMGDESDTIRVQPMLLKLTLIPGRKRGEIDATIEEGKGVGDEVSLYAARIVASHAASKHKHGFRRGMQIVMKYLKKSLGGLDKAPGVPHE